MCVRVCVSHGVVSDAVVFGLSGQAVGRTLPAAESLGLVVVDLHWPLPRHWQHIKHGPVTGVCMCVCVCVCVCGRGGGVGVGVDVQSVILGGSLIACSMTEKIPKD